MVARLACAACCLWLLAAPCAAQTKTELRDREYQADIQPLLKKYCFECHGDRASEGDFSLESYTSLQKVLNGRRHWLKVLQRLEQADMPPKDADEHPSQEEYARLAKFVDLALNDIDCSNGPTAGHVTLRRLTRYEYRNTVRDLLGVDYEPAANFPADEVGYGFDNIGDVLSLPPILLEKYLLAAETISQQVILADPPPAKEIVNVPGARMQGNGNRGGEGPHTLASQGEIYTDVNVPARGEYLLRISARADLAGDELPKMTLAVDGQQKHVFEVGNDDQVAVFDHKLQLEAGKRRVALAFINDFYDPDNANPKRRDRNLHVARLQVTGPLGGGREHLPENHLRLVKYVPNDKLSWAEAAKQNLSPIASRAFRRPATDEELQRLVQVVELAKEHGDSFETGMQLGLQAVLVSPYFLFKVEASPDPSAGPEAVRKLNDFELAARLSYFLWSTLPDEELFQLAAKNQLRTGDNLERQVRRMLADPRSQALVENFAGQWLTLRNLDGVQPSSRLFRLWNAQLRAAMRKETELFVGEVMRQDLSVLRLLDADFTFVDEQLAKLYGLEGVRGPEFRKVSLAGTPRGGILTQGSILTVTSNPTRTSAVKRGKWIMENLLNESPPPPPPGVPELVVEDRRNVVATVREQMEKHRADPNCKSCHLVMDSLGFALENYDAIGAYREKEGPFPIDASGVLPTGEKITGAVELRQLLLSSKREQYVDCLAEKMLTYALGRGLEYYDQCAIAEITSQLKNDDYRFSTLIVEVVRSYPFQHQGVKRSE